MYQKIKYIIIATMVLLVIVVVLTLDANTRYASMNKQNKEHNTKSISDINREYYAMQQRMNQAAQNKNVSNITQTTSGVNRNLQNMSDEEDEDNDNVSSSRRDRQRLYSQTTSNNSENINKEESPVHLEVLDTPKGNLSCESCEANETYKIEKVFNLDGNEFAIISMTKEMQGSTYINCQYAIYKKVNDEYKYSNYLFELTSDANSTIYTIDIEENNDGIIIKRHNITRKLDNNIIKNGYIQYNNYPVLKFTKTEETDSEINNYQQ